MKTLKFDIGRIFREPDHFLQAPKHLREDKEFIQKCCNENGGDFFVYVNDQLKQDEDFVFENSSLHSSPSYLKEYKGYTFCKCLSGRAKYFSIPREYRYFDHDIALAVAYEGQLLEHYSPEFAFNKVSAFFYNSYDSFNYDELTPKLQRNIYLAMASITKSHFTHNSNNKYLNKNISFNQMLVIYDSKHFPNILKNFQLNPKFIQHVLARNPEIYPYLDKKFKNKEKYLLIALQAKNPEILEFNHSKYGIWCQRNNRLGDILLSAPEKFHNTKNLYRAAILGFSNFEHYKGKMNVEIARKIVEINPLNYDALNDYFQNHDLIIRTTIRKYPSIIQHISPKHTNYLKYVKIAIQVDGHLLTYIPENLWKDQLIEAALKNSGYIYRQLSDEIKKNEKYIRTALRQSGEMYKEIPSSYKSNTEIIWLALKNKPSIYEFLPTNFKNDLEICEYIYTKLPRMMEFMPKKCLINRYKISKALHIDGLAWEFIPHKLKQDHNLIHIAESQNPLILSKMYDSTNGKFPFEYIKMMNKQHDLYSTLPIALRNDPELALDAIILNIDNIYFLPVSLMKNDEFMEKVYKIFGKECKRQWKIFKMNCRKLVA